IETRPNRGGLRRDAGYCRRFQECFFAERAAAGPKFKENRAERKHIRPGIKRRTQMCFRCHVSRGSRNPLSHCCALNAFLRSQAGESEIADFDPPFLSDQDVFRLDITMNKATGVGSCQSLKTLPGDPAKVLLRDSPVN